MSMVITLARGEVSTNRTQGGARTKPRGGTFCCVHHHSGSLGVGAENQSHSTHTHKFPSRVGWVPVTTSWGLRVRRTGAGWAGRVGGGGGGHATSGV
jgi:DNA mismatch repair protein MutH